MNLADRIQLLRKSKGLSQEELADKIGVSRQAVSKWESDQSTPDIEKVIALSNYFETTTDYLLKGIEPVNKIGKKRSAVLFSVGATILNAVGLLISIGVWIEHQRIYEVIVGLIFMMLGTGIFYIGQVIDAKDKLKAKRLFILPNVWILLFIPMSFCYNILIAIFGHYSPMLSPVPIIEYRSIISFILFFIVYFAVCICTDIFTVKKYNSDSSFFD